MLIPDVSAPGAACLQPTIIYFTMSCSATFIACVALCFMLCLAQYLLCYVCVLHGRVRSLPCTSNLVSCALQARLWVQLMRDLRHGVQLKKVREKTFNSLPTEYQLTPFEMLMQDIRARNYKLRKVMVSAVQQVTSVIKAIPCCFN